NPRIEKISRIAREKEGVSVRPINMKKFWQEVEIIKTIYNDAWSRNWGFVPLTDAEIDHLAHDLKPVVDPELVLFAMVEGKEVAFALALPDYNQVLIRIKNGRLLPFGIFKLLYYSRKIDAARVFTLGVMQKYQKSRGIGPLLYQELFTRGTKIGYSWGEFSWILETNKLMNAAIQILGGKVHKRYRIYEKVLL
ncbi:MAG: N-acetyltransferase, partial [Calditrichaeota bacterium]